MFTPFSSPFPKPFPVVATGWWLAGGIAPSSCVAAYQAKGAESQARSYVNLASPGTYDLTPGVEPTWSEANGWIGSYTAYLKTGIVAEIATWSFIVRFSSATSYQKPLGSLTSGKFFTLTPYFSTGISVRYHLLNTLYDVAPPLTSGVLAIAGQNCYRNGSLEHTFYVSPGPSDELYVMACNDSGSPYLNFTGEVQAVAIYRAALTAPQVAALTAAMNLL